MPSNARFLLILPNNKRGHALSEEGQQLLRTYGTLVIARSREEIIAALPTAQVVLVSPWHLPPTKPEDWQAAGSLEVIAGTFDNRFHTWLDFPTILSEGVEIIDTSRSMTPTVAEFGLAMTLNLIRDIPETIRIVREGGWKPSAWERPHTVFGDLTGRRVGLAGFGSINRRYAELLAPFQCDVQAYDPYVQEEAMAACGVSKCVSLEALAADSEIFVVGIPPVPPTLGIISATVIDALPRGSLFVLLTRMAVVEQQALWARLARGELEAAIDVFDPEPPPPDAPFRTNPHVLPTPHVAGDTLYCHQRCFMEACRDALAVLQGQAPRYAASLRDYHIYTGQT